MMFATPRIEALRMQKAAKLALMEVAQASGFADLEAQYKQQADDLEAEIVAAQRKREAR